MEEPNSFLMNLPFNDTFKNISEYFSKIYMNSAIYSSYSKTV